MEAALAIESVRLLTKSAGSPHRLRGMADAIAAVDREGIPGAIVECGIWQGGYLILARQLSPAREVWGYDTFAGMTKPGEFDVSRGGRRGQAGKSAVRLEQVIENCKAAGVYDPELLRLIVGPVEQTLLEHRPAAVAVLRLDTDWYASTLAELEHLWPLLSPGGVLIVDDFGHWLGSRKAVQEFFGDAMPPYTMLDYTALQMVKPR